MGLAINNPGNAPDDEELEQSEDSLEESGDLEGQGDDENGEGDDEDGGEEGDDVDGDEDEEADTDDEEAEGDDEDGEDDPDGEAAEAVEVEDEALDQPLRFKDGRTATLRELLDNQIENHPKWLELQRNVNVERQQAQQVVTEAMKASDSWSEVSVFARTDPFGYLWHEIENAVANRVIDNDAFQELKDTFGRLVDQGKWNPQVAEMQRANALQTHRDTVARERQGQGQGGQPAANPEAVAKAEHAIMRFQLEKLGRKMTTQEEQLLKEAAHNIKFVQGHKLPPDELLTHAWAAVQAKLKAQGKGAGKGKPPASAAAAQPRRSDGTFDKGRPKTKTRFSDLVRKGQRGKPKPVRADAGAADTNADDDDLLQLAGKVFNGMKKGRV